MWDLAAQTPILGELRFYLPPRPGRKGRHIVQREQALRVCLPTADGGDFEATTTMALEMSPPPGEKPLEWRLLSNREANNLAEAAELVDWYRCRWEIDCEVVFDREEWQAVWLVARKPLPPEPPKLNDAIRMIASFGGFLARKGDGEPGAKSLWQGLQRVMNFAMGIRAVRDAETYV